MNGDNDPLKVIFWMAFVVSMGFLGPIVTIFIVLPIVLVGLGFVLLIVELFAALRRTKPAAQIPHGHGR